MSDSLLSSFVAKLDKKEAERLAEQFLDNERCMEYLCTSILYSLPLHLWFLSFNPHPLEGVLVVQVDDLSRDAKYAEINYVGDTGLPVAYLGAEVQCPNCSSIVYDLFPFRWGVCSDRFSEDPKPGQLYRVRDAINWQTSEQPFSMMVGNAYVRDVIIYNEYFYAFGPCQVCKFRDENLAGAITIQNKVIEDVTLYRHNWSELGYTAQVREADGTLVPWYESTINGFVKVYQL